MTIGPPRGDRKPDWSGLWLRTQRSCITTLDFARIFIFDGILLAMGKAVVYLTEKLVAPGNRFLEAAHLLSHMLFLLLYFITVGYHVVEFIREQPTDR